MDKTIYYNYLYDYYGNLLTDKQREYYEEKLKLYEKKKKIASLISILDDKIKNRIEEII